MLPTAEPTPPALWRVNGPADRPVLSSLLVTRPGRKSQAVVECREICLGTCPPHSGLHPSTSPLIDQEKPGIGISEIGETATRVGSDVLRRGDQRARAAAV